MGSALLPSKCFFCREGVDLIYGVPAPRCNAIEIVQESLCAVTYSCCSGFVAEWR
jgi:hypothetical protein